MSQLKAAEKQKKILGHNQVDRDLEPIITEEKKNTTYTEPQQPDIVDKTYDQWVIDTNQTELTNTQSRFAKWLIFQRTIITQIGDLEKIFESVRRFLKQNP